MGEKKNKKNKHEVNAEGIYPNIITENGVSTTTFSPMGTGHQLQHLITEKLHKLIVDDPNCKYTLAELGYLHFISVQMENRRLKIQIYFDPKLALTKTVTMSGQIRYQIRPELMYLFNNRFVILSSDNAGIANLDGVVTIEKILCPQGKIKFDELGRNAMYIKKDALDMKEREVVAINCNMLITMAFLLDTDFNDEAYKVSVQSASNNVNSDTSIMIDGNTGTYPAWITVQWNGGTKFDGSHALEYLLRYRTMHQSTASKMDKILHTAEVETIRKKDSEKKSKKNKKNPARGGKGMC